MRRIFPFACAVLFIIAPACGQYLQQFSDEDKDLSIRVQSDGTATPTYSVTTRLVTFSFSFSVDRNGSYRILHAAECSGSRIAGGTGTSGTLTRGATVSVNIQLSYDDIVIYGKDIVICAQDTAAYKTASLVKNFSSGLATTLTAVVLQINESYGGGGTNISSGVSTEFPLFQANFTSGSANRGGTTAANSASNPYSHGVYIDPNDNYRFKYIVADRGNHRVLIFNQVPTSATAAADVVVGQSGFTGSSANAGAGIGAQGFNEPVHASVSAAGYLYVTDYNNNRVLGYNRIPTINNTSADFVLGQNTMTTITANAFGSGDDQSLNHPYATHAIGGKLYIVDKDNNRIIVFNSIPAATGAAADFVIGQSGFGTVSYGSSDYRIAFGNVSNYLNAPYDLLIDQNRLYISDTGNHRVLVFNSVPTVSNARPTYVLGHSDATFSAPDHSSTIAASGNVGLNFPTSMAAQNNKLALADQVNNRIVFYDLPITADDTAAQQVLGQVNLFSNAAGTTQTTFSLVKGLIFDNGYIWAADGSNNRVKVLQLPY